jgi:hypothetical protein
MDVAFLLMLLTLGGSGCSAKHDQPVAVAQDGLPARIHLWDLEDDIMRFTENLKVPRVATAVREWGVAEIEKVQAGTTSDKSTIKRFSEDDLPQVIFELAGQRPIMASVRTFRDASKDYLTIVWGSGRGLFGLVVSKQDIAPGRYATITRVEENIFVWR